MNRYGYSQIGNSSTSLSSTSSFNESSKENELVDVSKHFTQEANEIHNDTSISMDIPSMGANNSEFSSKMKYSESIDLDSSNYNVRSRGSLIYSNLNSRNDKERL